MFRPVIKFSKGGFIATSLFLMLAMGVFVWVFFIASKNPADSGESGILLLPFAMPWIMMLPGAWVGPFIGLGCIFFNALILYFLFGGFRIKKSSE